MYYQFIFQVFNGNSGKDDIVKHSLKEYASARLIRFQPTTSNNHKALRVEVFGTLISSGAFCISNGGLFKTTILVLNNNFCSFLNFLNGGSSHVHLNSLPPKSAN